jgi:PKD repeat protein
MRRILLCVFVFALAFSPSWGQKEANNWHFGSFAGLDFATPPPVPLMSSMIFTTEGSASISDTAGNLLFYADGVTVYNANNSPMLNGNGLTGDVSSTQSAIIIRQPDSYTIYYIFTVDADGGPDGLRYSIVDMTLDGGLGDVTATKNVLLQEHMTEKLCAVNANNDEDVWVMAHGWGDNAFYAYKLTAAGLSATPVISHTGTVHDSTTGTNPFQNTYGYMKFAPDGSKIALAIGYQDMAELLDFSNISGDVNNPLPIPMGEHVYGVEFSPNSGRLYLTHYNNLTQTFNLSQYNLAALTPADIIASKTTLYTTFFEEVRALQVGKDHRIYVAKANEPFLGVIYYPDTLGVDAFYQNNDLPLGGNTSYMGLPNFNASYFRVDAVPDARFRSDDSTICANSCVQFTDMSFFHPTSWYWEFPGATPATSQLPNPGPVCYTAPGVYAVTLVATNSKGSDTMTMSSFITVLPAPAVPTITAASGTLNSSTGVTYQWYRNNVLIAGATSQSYSPTQSGDYTVVITDANGCEATSAIKNFVPQGIEELAEAGINIYPNPVTDILTLELSGDWKNGTELTITNVSGMKVLHSSLEGKSSGPVTVNMQSLAPGVYIGQLNNGVKWINFKILKQ